MPTQTLHRGRMIDHLQLVTDRLEASRRFEAVFHGPAQRSAASVTLEFSA